MKYERGEIVFHGTINNLPIERYRSYRILRSTHEHSRIRCTDTLRVYNKVSNINLTSETEYNMEKYNL